MHTNRLFRRAAVVAAATATALAGMIVPAVASAAPRSTPGPVVAGTNYLALGDSVTFGYRESNTKPAPDYSKAYTFVGYPTYVGRALGLHPVNPSCPGETSGSLVSTSTPSYACENSYVGTKSIPIGYRTLYPLHVKYATPVQSQLQFAVAYLTSHPRTTLVSLMIGANDAFRCQTLTKDHCTSKKELTAVLTGIAHNVATILGAVRNTGYTGQIVILNYYSTDYASKTADESSQLLNAAMDGAAQHFGVEIADGYKAFEIAARHSGGNTCKAGLLTQLPKGVCGVHPSFAGQQVLAETVMAAAKK